MASSYPCVGSRSVEMIPLEMGKVPKEQKKKKKKKKKKKIMLMLTYRSGSCTTTKNGGVFDLNPYSKALTTDELWEWAGERDIYRWKYANAWNKTAIGLDGNAIWTS